MTNPLDDILYNATLSTESTPLLPEEEFSFFENTEHLFIHSPLIGLDKAGFTGERSKCKKHTNKL